MNRRQSVNIVLAALILLGSAAFAEEIVPKKQPKKLDLYLMIGQSNMAGRAAYGKEDAGPMDGCYLLDDKGQWVVATNPLNRFSTIRKGLESQRVGPAYSFALAMRKKFKKQEIGLIVNARGGSSIKQWTRDGQYYKDAITRTKQAMKSGTLKGICWHQGETDEKDANYLAKLKTLIENLREDLDAPKLPFVAGQVNNVPLINEQIAKLPEAVKNTAFATSEGLKATDRWHFNLESCKLLGERYAEKMIKLLKGKKKSK